MEDVQTSYPKRKFGKKSPVFCSFQSSWYKRWPWVHYDQAFCFTCLKAKRNGILKCSASIADESFLSRDYSNWKDVSGMYGGFTVHEKSDVHKYSIQIASNSFADVGDLLSTELQEEKEIN